MVAVFISVALVGVIFVVIVRTLVELGCGVVVVKLPPKSGLLRLENLLLYMPLAALVVVVTKVGFG